MGESTDADVEEASGCKVAAVGSAGARLWAINRTAQLCWIAAVRWAIICASHNAGKDASDVIVQQSQ